MIAPKDVILFQGDSITDCGRARENAAPNDAAALGGGYVRHIANRLLQERGGDGLTIYNRGIGGNRVVDLYARWKIDAINLDPDLISILIGVNDTWHEFSSRNGVEVDRYETVYRMLLDYTRKRLPDVKLVLCEPFVLRCGAVTDAWFPEMPQRQEIVRRLAEEFEARFVPFQDALNKALAEAGPEHWTRDGVHPTPAGHELLARTWIETVCDRA
ncbi:MAG: SGNH/GDSL hydrolase family protein [Planctomycetota bacterium]